MRGPGYTQVYNLFIESMHRYTGNTVKVFLAISRKTVGWHKVSDKISYSQIAGMTGISYRRVRESLDPLLQDGWILQSGNQKSGYKYDLNIEIEPDTPLFDTEDETKRPNKKTEKDQTMDMVSIDSAKTMDMVSTTKEKNLKKEDIELHGRIRDSFLKVNTRFTSYPKEGKHINGLIEKAKQWNPEDPSLFIYTVMKTFWNLKKHSGKSFWGDQPYLPSTLNSTKIFDRVLEHMKEKHIEGQGLEEYYSRRENG